MVENEQPTCEGCGRPLLSPRERFAAECSLCCFKRATREAKANRDTDDDAVEVPRRGMFEPGTLVQHYGSNDPDAMHAPDSSPLWEKIGPPLVATADGRFDLNSTKAFRFFRATAVGTVKSALPEGTFIHFDFGPRTMIVEESSRSTILAPLSLWNRLMILPWLIKRRFQRWMGWRQ